MYLDTEINFSGKTENSGVGLIHTRHFGIQYFDKKILRYLRHRFLLNNQGKLLTKHNIRYVVFYNSLPWLKSMSQISQYLFIEILWAKMSRVTWALVRRIPVLTSVDEPTKGRYTLDIFARKIPIKRYWDKKIKRLKRHFSSNIFFPVCFENIFLERF